MTADSALPTPYIVPLAVRGRILRAQPKGLPLINLGFNELPYGPPPKVAEAISAVALRANYYGAPGCDALRETLSRANGLAGLRVGWAHAPAWLMPAFYAARGMGSVNAVAQAAATAALEDIETVRDRVAQIVAERDRVAAALAVLGIPSLPSGANFLPVTVDGAGPEVTEALVEYLFDQAGIIVNCTREAGLERYLRFCLGLPEHNDVLIDCMTSFLKRNRP